MPASPRDLELCELASWLTYELRQNVEGHRRGQLRPWQMVSFSSPSVSEVKQPPLLSETRAAMLTERGRVTYVFQVPIPPDVSRFILHWDSEDVTLTPRVLARGKLTVP